MKLWTPPRGGWRAFLGELADGQHWAFPPTRGAAVGALQYIEQLEARLAEFERTRTLGGPAPEVDETWANRTIQAPASATDPAAPKLRRDS